MIQLKSNEEDKERWWLNSLGYSYRKQASYNQGSAMVNWDRYAEDIKGVYFLQQMFIWYGCQT